MMLVSEKFHIIFVNRYSIDSGQIPNSLSVDVYKREKIRMVGKRLCALSINLVEMPNHKCGVKDLSHGIIILTPF